MSSTPRTRIGARTKVVTALAVAALMFGQQYGRAEVRSAQPTDAEQPSVGAAGGVHGLRAGRRAKMKRKKGKHNRGGADSFASVIGGRKDKPSKKARGNKRASEACRESVKEGKQLVVRGELIEARELLADCAKPSCGRRVAGACKLMRTRLANDIPTVVFAAEGGSPDADIAVSVDDKTLTSKIDGRSLPVNPGNHEFVFNSAGSAVAKQSILIVQGQHNRVLPIALSSSKKNEPTAAAVSDATDEKSTDEGQTKEKPSVTAAVQPADSEEEEEETIDSKPARSHGGEVTDSTGHSSWPTYALAGVGVAALGTAGLFTFWGLKDNKDLGEMCAPNCNPDSVHHVRNLYLTADIAAGVGVVALVAATWMALRSSDESGKPASKEVAHIRRIDLQPTRAGAIASVGGTF